MAAKTLTEPDAPPRPPEAPRPPRTRRRPSWRRRWATWRARYSIAGMLARMDERKAVSVVAGVNGGLAILAIGFLSWVTDLPLMFPALGPTAFILFSAPTSEAAAPRSVVLGHFAGIASGWAVWYLISTLFGEAVSIQLGGLAPVISAAVALAITCVLLVRMSCPHAPACASSLIVALGGAPDWLSVLLMAAAVVWITLQAVAMNRLAGLHVPIWSPGRKRGHSTFP